MLDFLRIEAFIHSTRKIVYIFVHRGLWKSGKPKRIEISTKNEMIFFVKRKLSTILFVIISQLRKNAEGLEKSTITI